MTERLKVTKQGEGQLLQGPPDHHPSRSLRRAWLGQKPYFLTTLRLLIMFDVDESWRVIRFDHRIVDVGYRNLDFFSKKN